MPTPTMRVTQATLPATMPAIAPEPTESGLCRSGGPGGAVVGVFVGANVKLLLPCGWNGGDLGWNQAGTGTAAQGTHAYVEMTLLTPVSMENDAHGAEPAVGDCNNAMKAAWIN